MPSVIKRIGSLYERLKRFYVNGEIAYPRVFNDYIRLDNLKFYEYPHKPIQDGFDIISASLNKESYPVRKETIPLYLTNAGIATPATLVKNMLFIDRFVDDLMQVRDAFDPYELEEKLERLMEQIRADTIIAYTGDIEKGFVSGSGIDPYEMKESDLLGVVSPNGDIQKMFKMEITPYSIVLSPEDMEKTNERNEDEDELISRSDERCGGRAFKISASPTENYPSYITSRSIKVRSMQALYEVDDTAQILREQEQTVEDRKKRTENILQPRSMSVGLG